MQENSANNVPSVNTRLKKCIQILLYSNGDLSQLSMTLSQLSMTPSFQ